MGRTERTRQRNACRPERHSRRGMVGGRRLGEHADYRRPHLGSRNLHLQHRRPNYSRNWWQGRFYRNERPYDARRSAIAESRRREHIDLVRRELDTIESKDPSEIILILGGNVYSFKNYLRLFDTSESINKKLLTVLDKGFKSMSTQALLLNVMNTMVETEYILCTIKLLKRHFEGRVVDKEDASQIHAATAVLRILIKMYTKNPSAIPFIRNSFSYMSDLMGAIRNSLKADDPNHTYRSDHQTENSSTPEKDVHTLYTNSDRGQNTIEECEQTSGTEGCKVQLSCDIHPLCLAQVEELFAILDEHRLECISRGSKIKVDDTENCIKNPIEDFRELPIFPCRGDLNGDIKPNLRINKAEGGYSSVDDYLDVQFRLLREDFVGPLREGILSLTRQTFGKNKKTIQEIKVYENVRIESFVCGDGLSHVLLLDNRHLKNIRWHMTKRLKYGSLVCLSADNFETCFFATVVNNDIKFRKQGRVHVKFALDSKQMNLLIGSTFTMVEPKAYFEAYRPVLSSLQTITENSLPFQEYIVKCNTDILPPKYLRRLNNADISFDLRSLLEPNVVIHSTYQNFRKDERVIGRKEAFSNESKDLERINILEESKWPKEDMMHLDRSQLDALRTALTREFSIIQGPPGCGKTHIGLEIVKVLVHNQSLWRHEDGTRAQILIVCYTNHAVDQFLEGICSFFNGDILRVGSQSSNTNMEQHNLKAIRSHFRKKKKFPLYLHRSRVSAQQKLKTLQCVLNLESEKIKCLRENILHENSLYSEMGSLSNQFLWLKSKRSRKCIPSWLSFLDGSPIVEWLGIIDMAEHIQNDIKFADKGRQTRAIKEAVDEENDIENRKSKIEEKLDFQGQIEKEQKRKLWKFRRDNFSLDFDDNNDLNGHFSKKSNKEMVTRKRRALREKVQLLLRSTKPMSELEAISVEDIRSIRFTTEKRWSLYLFWVQKKCIKMYLDIEKKIVEFEAAHECLKEISMMEDRHIFREAEIIGMTVTGAAKHKTILSETRPTIKIVEEAAEVLESNLISNLTSGCEHLILIGDHKQLKPKTNFYRLELEYNLAISLFERMERNGIRCDSLQLQHRMRPSIADNVRPIYKVLIDHESVKRYEPIRGVSHDTFFIDHRAEERKDKELNSYSNEHEIKYLIALGNYLLLQGYNASEITILTTYKEQLLMLKRELLEQGDILNGVRITTVDEYQGEENDIILLSLVRSNNKCRVGFIEHENRVCVALSRAKKGLYVIGNFEIFAMASCLWKSIINNMNHKGLVGKALPLYCQNHPNDDGLKVENPTDFQKAPEGGCRKLCDVRLDCGHTCERHCHIDNREHKDIICRKPCSRKCVNGHQCRLICWRQCVCDVNIIVTLPICRHIVLCVCSTDIKTYACEKICQKKLDCGHECIRKCKDPCICMKPVNVILPKCGHETTIPCSVRPDQHKCVEYIKKRRTDCDHYETILCRDASKSTNCKSTCNLVMDCGHVCKEQCDKKGPAQLKNYNEYKYSRCPRGHLTYCKADCEEKMKCGHTCKGNCSKCFQGRWHEPCDKGCNCDLICGHKCKGKCGYCLPCTEICIRTCRHLVCESKYTETCMQCTEPCSWQCDHFKCTKLCGEICDRPRCNKPCKELLSCKHECIGMCGDPCPILCRICNHEDVGKLSFENENLPDARFVQLQDCNHLIKYDIMDKYMDTDEGVCLKRCPICNGPIRTTMGNRYENIVNRIFNELNNVKQHVLQDNKYGMLNTCVFHKSNDMTQVKRSRYDPMHCLSKGLACEISTVSDCQRALRSLNPVAVQQLIKSVSTKNEYSLHTSQIPAVGNKRSLRQEKNDGEPQSKKQRYGEISVKTDTKSLLKGNDIICEIEKTEKHRQSVHDVASVSKETDTRKVQIKNIQSSKLITTEKEPVESNFYKRKIVLQPVKAPVKFNDDIDIYADDVPQQTSKFSQSPIETLRTDRRSGIKQMPSDRKPPTRSTEMPDRKQREHPAEMKITDLRFLINGTVRCDTKCDEKTKEYTDNKDTRELQTHTIAERSISKGEENLAKLNSTRLTGIQGNDLRHLLNRKRAIETLNDAWKSD